MVLSIKRMYLHVRPFSYWSDNHDSSFTSLHNDSDLQQACSLLVKCWVNLLRVVMHIMMPTNQLLLLVCLSSLPCYCQVSHNALFWKSHARSVNDSIYDFDWVVLEIPVKNCIEGKLLTSLYNIGCKPMFHSCLVQRFLCDWLPNNWLIDVYSLLLNVVPNYWYKAYQACITIRVKMVICKNVVHNI